MGKLDGKKAIVTGASRGIGRAISRAFAKEGASVFLTADGTQEELRQEAETCLAISSGAGTFETGMFNLADPGTAEAMVEAAIKCFGKIDILVNNAGIRRHVLFGEFTYEDFEEVVAVNLRAAFFASQAVLPSMRAAGGGRIIHIASQLGVVAARRTAIYGITKAGLIHLTRVMALELAKDGIEVNAISPGPTATEYYIKRLEKDTEDRKQRLADIPAGRFAKPEEIGAAAVFLASGEASFIQGHNLIVDGGYVAH
jgi:NAD(P)-dependent dehydrogenase (short-subunit alcohol dehydrogenase family)